MLRLGYDKRLATGIIAASGTLGQIIPPSVVLVVLGDQLGVSVGDLFIGSALPGLLMVLAFSLYIGIVTLWKPQLAPPLPKQMREIGGGALALKVIQVMVPPLLLILLVLGSIFVGLATPTEAGAVGAIGAVSLAAVQRQLSWKSLMDVADGTHPNDCDGDVHFDWGECV